MFLSKMPLFRNHNDGFWDSVQNYLIVPRRKINMGCIYCKFALFNLQDFHQFAFRNALILPGHCLININKRKKSQMSGGRFAGAAVYTLCACIVLLKLEVVSLKKVFSKKDLSA